MRKSILFNVNTQQVEISLPKQVQVTMNFDLENVIGIATVTQEGDDIVADITLRPTLRNQMYRIKKSLQCEPAGRITRNKQGKVVSYRLIALSLNYDVDIRAELERKLGVRP